MCHVGYEIFREELNDSCIHDDIVISTGIMKRRWRCVLDFFYLRNLLYIFEQSGIIHESYCVLFMICVSIWNDCDMNCTICIVDFVKENIRHPNRAANIRCMFEFRESSCIYVYMIIYTHLRIYIHIIFTYIRLPVSGINSTTRKFPSIMFMKAAFLAVYIRANVVK